ncbi:MAG: polysaccharide deacetylase family protein, partial [Caulobacteraceae bacterium]
MGLDGIDLARTLRRGVTRRLPIKFARARGESAVASITFDDFPRSAWTLGGPILERFGAKATYYAAGRFCGLNEEGVDYFTTDDLLALRNAGHEIGDHGFGHDPAIAISTAALHKDCEKSASFFRDRLQGETLASYAWPFGEASPRTKAVMARRFSNSRGIQKGVNAGWIDLAELKAIPLEYRRWRPDEIEAAIRRACACGGWVVFFTHDVADDPM